MRLIDLKVLLCCSVFLGGACSKEDLSENYTPGFTSENIQTHPHKERLFLSSSVKEIREYKTDGMELSDTVFAGIMTFDRVGNLTGYDPSGITFEPPLRWVPVLSETYAYRYDAKGRLSEITVTAGTDVKNYRLTYGNHNTFVPLPFELKPVGEVLLEGLVSVSSDEAGFSYAFDGQQATGKVQEFGVTDEKIIYFESGYPARKISTRRYLEEVISSEEWIYTYDIKRGAPVASVETRTEGETVVKSRSTFVQGGLPEFIYTGAEEEMQKSFAYNSNNWLVKVEMNVNGVSNGKLTCWYDVDERNNWTRREQTVKGFVGWEYQEGKEITIREISYW